MTKYRKNAKVFADTGPYQLYWGDVHVRTELIENCPDVVQALTDMAVEALLWGRIRPKEATDIREGRSVPGRLPLAVAL